MMRMMKMSDTRQLCDFIMMHDAELNHVNVATSQSPSMSTGSREWQRCRVQHALDNLVKGIVETLHPQQISSLPMMANKRYTRSFARAGAAGEGDIRDFNSHKSGAGRIQRPESSEPTYICIITVYGWQHS